MKFRTRIFSISILTVSAVLAVIVSLSWSRIMKVELEQLDARLCMEEKRIMDFYLRKERRGNNPLSVFPMASNAANADDWLINDLTQKLRINSASQLMLFVESNESGVLTQSDGVDVQAVISTLNSESEEQFTSADRNGATVLCHLVFFEHNKSQWRASFYHTAQAQSFIAVDVSATTNQLKSTLREALIVVIPFSLLLCILGAWFITSNTIRPINRLQKSMNMVTKKDLSHRLPEHKADQEFKILIAAYNTMLERLEDSFQQISRFTADAAHELKTPLTVLRGKLEQAVINENTEQLDFNAILDEVGHLSAITRKLLLLSQADAGSMALHLEAINITDLLDELTADMELLSDELVLHCAIEQALIIQGDAVLLRQLLNNVLVNVMRYSLHEKGVTIQAKQNGGQIDVLISNFCLPMSDAVRVKLFERFYRGEPEHMQGLSGSGLGLSLAREIARAHDGELIIEASDKELFTLRLSLPITK